MKTSIKFFVALCATYFLASGLALAEPADVFIDEGGCGLLNEDNVPVDNGDLVSISANSANGNATITCSIDLPRTTTGRSVVFNYDNTDRLCRMTGGNRTEDWHQVISASGKAKLTCHYME